ncbi:hypothetical protein OE88DRAFT_1654530 [Heliocybe sulcata]|uniref:Uncharacterized protein n=1 Tax=Heliocybe sulcata TaxID=5364 RepID=A0A5C3N9R2_9AGAM|nr:hypothetical protein OE88DRAFT_1654530 [Heliocybe sulcata]
MSTMLRIDNAQLNGNLQPTLSSASGLPDVSAASVANTLSKLYSSGAASNAAVSLIPSHLIITPATASPPSAQVQDRLRDLTLTAHEAANELCCGSLLAGQGSETDEYGDIAIWLGEGPYADNALGVLSALGLEGFIDRADDPATTVRAPIWQLLLSLRR